MSELTKEWLLTTIAELEEELDAVPGAVNEDAFMALAAMKIALASLEAESVAFRSKLKLPSSIGSEHWDYTDHRQPDAFELESCVIERLYTAPPAPVSDSLMSELLAIAKKAADAADECAHAEWSDDSMEHSTAIADWERRAAMLQGVENSETPTTMQTAPALDSSPKIAESPTGINQDKSEPVTTAYKLPFEQWLSQQTGTIDVECGCVMTEVFFHWLRVAYEAANSSVIPDGVCPCCGRKPLKNRTCSVSGCDGKHVARGFCIKHYAIERKKDPSRRESIRAADKRYRARKAAAPQQEISHALAKGMERYGDAMQELAKKEVK